MLPIRKTFLPGVALAVFGALAQPAQADFKVFSPDANPGELAIETVGDYGRDPNPNKSNEQSFTQEFEYGVNNFWRTEFELEQERSPGVGFSTQFSQVTTENIFQFTERGEYWLDAGFFAEYGWSTLQHTANETTFGPILRKEFAGTINTVNLFVEKELGPYSSNRWMFTYAFETRVALGTPVEPGVQAYGQPSARDNRIGPMLFGKIVNLGPGSLVGNGGFLFGLTSASPRTTLRWQFEYEIHY
jgi:hypothetical protein